MEGLQKEGTGTCKKEMQGATTKRRKLNLMEAPDDTNKDKRIRREGKD